jgi:2,5-furandicarboxylate decarboxylase 1
MTAELTLNSFLEELSRRRLLKRLSTPLSPRYELAAAEQKLQDAEALLVERAIGSEFPVLFNLLNSKEKYALALGVAQADVPLEFERAVASASTPAQEEGDFLRNERTVDLDLLPIVTHFEKDAGPYVTSSLVVAKNRQTGTQNLSVHRLLKLSRRSFAIRMVEGRHLHRAFVLSKEAGRDLPVAVVIGVHPAVEIAASYQAPYGVDELNLANALLRGRLRVTKLENGLIVPANAEIVLEGSISQERLADDCMVEMLGNYDIKRKQPVLEVHKMYYRKGAMYRDILPGGREHRLLMSYAVEIKMTKAVRDVVSSTRRVVLTDGGRNWLHAVVQLKKRLEGEPKNAILAAFASHPSLKHVIVVDEDIDPEDPTSVEYAIATRFQASKGLIVVQGAKGSSLDPSSDQQKLLTDKVGIDATATLSKDWVHFEQGQIPGSEKIERKLKRIR